MKIIEPSATIIDHVDGDVILRKIELIGRNCYNSVQTDDLEKTKRFVASRIKDGHESILEHVSLTIRFITDRAIANEIVRHRIAAYTQSSTRYIKYQELEVIKPSSLYGKEETGLYEEWVCTCETAEDIYSNMLRKGEQAQTARSVLPLCTATTLYATYNLRELRHVLKLRTAKVAHPDMRALMIPLLIDLQNKIPVVFDDITVE